MSSSGLRRKGFLVALVAGAIAETLYDRSHAIQRGESASAAIDAPLPAGFAECRRDSVTKLPNYARFTVDDGLVYTVFLSPTAAAIPKITVDSVFVSSDSSVARFYHGASNVAVFDDGHQQVLSPGLSDLHEGRVLGAVQACIAHDVPNDVPYFVGRRTS